VSADRNVRERAAAGDGHGDQMRESDKDGGGAASTARQRGTTTATSVVRVVFAVVSVILVFVIVVVVVVVVVKLEPRGAEAHTRRPTTVGGQVQRVVVQNGQRRRFGTQLRPVERVASTIFARFVSTTAAAHVTTAAAAAVTSHVTTVRCKRGVRRDGQTGAKSRERGGHQP